MAACAQGDVQTMLVEPAARFTGNILAPDPSTARCRAVRTHRGVDPQPKDIEIEQHGVFEHIAVPQEGRQIVQPDPHLILARKDKGTGLRIELDEQNAGTGHPRYPSIAERGSRRSDSVEVP
ncbi:hypothetical protein THIOKS140004 [Thiocapsa sp. KS1]|nr:hypothetical protein THIOKS140004 [Thiocapsa sp. KS1]